MNSTRINKVWQDNIYRFNDAIRSDKETFETFIRIDKQHHERITRNISFFEKDKDFMALSQQANYKWIFDSSSYVFGAEVVFQFRALRLLLDYKGLDFLHSIPPIVVREAVVPTMRLSFPQTIFTNDISFIVLPMGWLDMNNYLSFGIKQTNDKNTKVLSQCILELQLRFLADDILQEFLMNNIDNAVSQSVMALIKIELTSRIKTKVPLFQDAYGDIFPDTFTGLYQRLAYGCETFTLAHEIGHIIHHEHKFGSVPDESRADQTAISAILKSNSNVVLGGGLKASKELSLLISSTMFNTLGNLHFRLLTFFHSGSLPQKEEFEKRSLTISEQVLKYKLIENEAQIFKTLLFLLKTYNQAFNDLLISVEKVKIPLKKEGHQIISSIFEE